MDFASAPGSDLFVTTALTSFETDAGSLYSDDVVIDGRCHRRLDARYYAWLRAQMVVAKNAAAAGRLAPASFASLRERFNVVHAWAVARFGEGALLAAVKSFDAKTYRPPRADAEDLAPGAANRLAPHGCGHFFPVGDFPFFQPVSVQALLKVDNIREIALGRDWTEKALLQNRGHVRFPCGGDWGLVCFLDDDATIAAVERALITIHRPRGSAMQFPNPDVEQPWRRAVREEAAPVGAGA
jgi:hypothetical protein